jgi:hypothetical protein
VVLKGGNNATLTDLENVVSEMIRQHSTYGDNWDPDHGFSCNCQVCDVCQITVLRYSQTGHVCSIVKGQRICGDPENAVLHANLSAALKEDRNYYLCEKTGFVHLCGDMCRANKDLTNMENEYVCPISGMVLGVEFKGEWWTDKDKQNNDLNMDEPEMDRDLLDMQNPHYVVKRIYDSKGNYTETKEYAAKSVTITHHLHYHNHPFEKKYWYYLMRCKNILWLILYSSKRQQIERQRLLTNYQSMEKNLDKYVRNCEKNKVVKCFQDIRAIVRYHMKARTDIPIWVPPLRIMEPLLFHYARIIVKFFWIILEKTGFGRAFHTHLPFDYFVLATINIMRTRGLVVNGCEILPHDQYLHTHVPDPSLLHHFGIQLNFMTRTRNHINKAITPVKPELLKVAVTNMDASLFHDTREKRVREHREQQDKLRYEQLLNKTNDGPADTGPSNKRRKK